MKLEHKEESKIIKFLNGRGFYLVVCICFIAIGIAAWTGVQGMKIVGNNQTGSAHSSGVPSRDVQGSISDTDTQSTDSESGLVSSFLESTFEEDTANDTESSGYNDSSKPEDTEAVAATYFINPVLGEVIKGYSATELQYSMTFGDMRIHKGIDIAADEGASVVASGDGVVSKVYTDKMLGTVVEIDHGNGILVKYCGLNSKPSVSVGQNVDSSTVIGAVASVPSESVEQHHLHLEFYLNGESVSPLQYISE